MKSGRKFVLCEVLQEPGHSFHHLLTSGAVVLTNRKCQAGKWLMEEERREGGREQHRAL